MRECAKRNKQEETDMNVRMDKTECWKCGSERERERENAKRVFFPSIRERGEVVLADALRVCCQPERDV